MTLAAPLGGEPQPPSPAGPEGGPRAQGTVCARILLVEDEALVALEMEAILENVGHSVVGTVDTTAGAVTLARALKPDLALVDVRLAHGDSGLDVASELAPLGIPVLFVTGNFPGEQTDRLALGCLHKPFGERQLVESVAAVMAIARGGAAPGRLPMGLHLFRRAS